MRYSKPVSALIIFIAVIALTSSALSQVRPIKGIDSSGQGLSYPGVYRDLPPSSFGIGIPAAQPLHEVDMKHSLQPLSRWAVPGYVPGIINLSGQGWNMVRIYGQIPTASGFILPEAIDDGRNIPAISDFTNPKWKPEEVDYQVPAFKEFMDEGWQSETGHHQPDLRYDLGSGDYSPGLTSFLKEGDRVPERPLL
ncbi:MAG TPA: hypothetical protein VN455_07020 [Methanotrichaceae archaeon]|nr:hypothetical protein [Methanotrichaceae archaeon]